MSLFIYFLINCQQLDTLGEQYAGNSVADYYVVQDMAQKKSVSVLPTTLTDMSGNLSSLTVLKIITLNTIHKLTYIYIY